MWRFPATDTGDGVASEITHLQHISFVRRTETSESIDLVGVADACGHVGSACVVSASFDMQGRLRQPARVEVIHNAQWLEIQFPLQLGNVLYAEASQRWGNRLLRFDRTPQGELAHTLLVRTTDPYEGGGAAWISWLLDVGGQLVGLTSDDWVPGTPESWLIRLDGRSRIRGLPVHQTLSVAALASDEIGIVFRRAIIGDDHMLHARGRARFARLGVQGRLRGDVENATLESLPPVLGDTLHTTLEMVGRRLHFVRRDALQGSVGSSVAIGGAVHTRQPPPRVSFSGTHFVVVHLEHVESAWVVRASAIQCEAI